MDFSTRQHINRLNESLTSQMLSKHRQTFTFTFTELKIEQ